MSFDDLAGKVALITGAAQGAGLGIAEVLADDGVSVALAGRTLSKLESVAEAIRARGGTAIAIRCDVGIAADITATVAHVVEELGTVDILANVAQSDVRGGLLLDISERDVQLLWETGALATWRFMCACHPYLRGGGVVINFGSPAQFAPQHYGIYAGVKDAIMAITRAAAVEWGADGIRCNAISPSVRSPSLEADVDDPERMAQIIARIPVGRLGEPSDIGRVAAFLCSNAAAMITGQLVLVDGGISYQR